MEHRRRWKDSIKVELAEISCILASSGSGLGQVARCCENCNATLETIKGREVLK
jgi:hypothetical protein